MRRTVTGLRALLFVGIAAVPAAAQQPLQVNATRDGAPAANVQFDMQFLNQPKVTLGATGAGGVLDLTLEMANLGKPTRVQVVVYDCPSDRSFVVFVEAGAAAPEENECRRRIAGWLWFGRARAVTIDVASGTMQVQGGQSFLGSTTGRLVVGGGAAALGAIALSAGGGSSADASPSGSPSTPGGGNNGGTTPFNPNGNYPVTNAISSDPGGHRTFIAMEGSTVLVITVTDTTIRITCPPGSKWTAINGTIANGQITGEGRGTAAGFSNVLFRFSGTLTLTGPNQGALSGSLTVGAGGEFPGGQPTVYTVSGRKQ